VRLEAQSESVSGTKPTWLSGLTMSAVDPYGKSLD
jgi:hypothetical protein